VRQLLSSARLQNFAICFFLLCVRLVHGPLSSESQRWRAREASAAPRAPPSGAPPFDLDSAGVRGYVWKHAQRGESCRFILQDDFGGV